MSTSPPPPPPLAPGQVLLYYAFIRFECPNDGSYSQTRLRQIASLVQDAAEDATSTPVYAARAHEVQHGSSSTVIIQVSMLTSDNEAAVSLVDTLVPLFGTSAAANNRLGVVSVQSDPWLFTGTSSFIRSPYPPPSPVWPPLPTLPPPHSPPRLPPAPGQPPADDAMLMLGWLALGLGCGLLAVFGMLVANAARTRGLRSAPRVASRTARDARGDGVEMPAPSSDARLPEKEQRQQGVPQSAVPGQPPEPSSPSRSPPVTSTLVEPLAPPARTSLEDLQQDINSRLANFQLQPPAWQHFLLNVYTHYPPPSLSEEERTRELSEVARIEGMSVGVTKALRRLLLLYHPDKNRAGSYSESWAAEAEQIARMATALLDYYRRRIQSSSELVARDDGESQA